jgi:hypothetical protein
MKLRGGDSFLAGAHPSLGDFYLAPICIHVRAGKRNLGEIEHHVLPSQRVTRLTERSAAPACRKKAGATRSAPAAIPALVAMSFSLLTIYGLFALIGAIFRVMALRLSTLCTSF